MKIVLKKFPTHIAISKNIRAPDRYIKINNQAIYNGALNKFSRAIAVNNLHDYVISQMPHGLNCKQYPVKINYLFKVVKNHGSISRRKGVICWKPPKKDYKANWDIDNLAFLWIKIINDTLTMCDVITDDTVDFVKGGNYEYEFVDNLEKMEIIITFTI